MFEGFDPDLRRASTPPAAVYLDATAYARERTGVFARTWQPVARTAALAEHGAFTCAELAGHSVVIVRDRDALRGFHNLCRHRAGPIATGSGCRKSLQCRYHGWTYRLDGQLVAAPEMDGVEGFDPAAIQLAPIAVEARGPLVFAALEPAATLAETLDGIALDPALRWVMRRDYDVACNWKVYVDNYLEGYHIPIVHPELHRELDYDQYRTELARYWSRQHAPLRPVTTGDRRYVPTEDETDAAYYWIFPNLMLNIYQGQLQTNLVVPLAVDRTRVVFDWYALDPPADPGTDPAWIRLVDTSELVQDQDRDICEAVQRNLASPAYRPGRYSVRRENGVHHFHGLLAEFLAD